MTKFSVTSVNFSAELGDETSPSFKEIATSLENKVERPECYIMSGRVILFGTTTTHLALAVNKSPAVYILSPAPDGL